VPATVQDGREQPVVVAQVVDGSLARVGTDVPDSVIDGLERQVEGKLPHPLD
jgi:hypothetical protein